MASSGLEALPLLGSACDERKGAHLAEVLPRPEDQRRTAARAGRRAEADGLPRAVCDFIAGMTDRYATETYRGVTP